MKNPPSLRRTVAGQRIDADVHEVKAAAKRSYTKQERQGRRFADLRPSVGDSGGSSSTNRTLFPTELRRPVRGRLEEVDN
jgi:hypothetical protein